MGGKSGQRLPAAPNYENLIRQQHGYDVEMLNQQTQANRPNIYDPTGSVKWSQDANGNWTQTTNWNPQTLANYNAYQGLQGRQLGAAGNALGALQNQIGKGFNYGPQVNLTQAKPGALPTAPNLQMAGAYDEAARNKAEQTAYNRATQLFGEGFGQQRDALEAKLAAQGIQPGSEAYNREMTRQQRNEDQAYQDAAYQSVQAGADEAARQYQLGLSGLGFNNQAAQQGFQNKLGLQDTTFQQQLAGQNAYNQAQQQGFGQAMQNYQLPLQMYQGLLGNYQPSGFQGQMYGGQAGGVTGPDLFSAGQAQYQSALDRYNARTGANAGKMQGLGSVAQGVGSFFGSDETLKTNIRELTPEQDKQNCQDLLSISGFTWDWIENGEPDSGVIAQHLQDKLSEFVAEFEHPIYGRKLGVNYKDLFTKAHSAIRYLARRVDHGLVE